MSRRLFPRLNVRWLAALLAHLAVASAARAHTCSEVKTAFQVRQIGPLKWVPEAPATDVNLLVCKHVGPSCCTRKMEESYKLASVRDTVQNIRSYSFELKFLLLSHATTFTDMYQSLFTFSEDHLLSLFESTYTSLSSGIPLHVSALFSSLSKYIQDTSNISVDAAVNQFYDHLFHLVHNSIIKPGIAEEDNLSECLHATRQDVDPFGPHVDVMAEELSDAMQAARALKRAFSMGEDLMNVTEVAPLTSECARALLKMQYCSHCQGLTLIHPCPEFCLNVMRGCLANMAELDMPWRHYLAILEDLLHTVAVERSMELALLSIRGHVNDAIRHAQLHEARISATVDKVCGPSVSANQSAHPTTAKMIPAITLAPEPSTNQSDPVMKQLGRLSHLRREFLKYIVRYKAFFAAVPEMLCEGEVVRDEPTCWSGNDVVESYKGRVVGNGILAQRHNPEVRVSGPDAMLAAVKERLEHFNQEIQQHMPALGHRDSWEDLGSGEGSSGDCDDEDGCQGSGEGTTKSSNTDSSVDTTVVVKSPPHDAPVGRFKPKLQSRAQLNLPSFTTLILILILGLQWTSN
ncbi:glypican-5 isoform X2 [Silurus meridionalis]|uniref:glypican-5 isoform X2 n=1 Tax=Silurus meridionalis TaxID=175797 RepID=UPI001EEBF848|nr:glypican-5 isoform X2 [Silurus meridionalis]